MSLAFLLAAHRRTRHDSGDDDDDGVGGDVFASA